MELCYVFFVLFFALFVLSAIINTQLVIGSQRRWAPAYLAACHHIHFILSILYRRVKNRPFPLTRHIAYTTACSYRSSCDHYKLWFLG